MFNLDMLIRGLDLSKFISKIKKNSEPEEDPYKEIPYGFFENDERIPKVYREQAKYGTPSLRRAFGVMWKHKERIHKRAEKRLERNMSIPGSITEPEDDFSFDIDELS